jgi:hypothetical protein
MHERRFQADLVCQPLPDELFQSGFHEDCVDLASGAGKLLSGGVGMATVR